MEFSTAPISQIDRRQYNKGKYCQFDFISQGYKVSCFKGNITYYLNGEKSTELKRHSQIKKEIFRRGWGIID